MRFSLRSRLLARFGLVVLLLLGVGLFALTRLRQDNRGLRNLATRVVPATRTVGDINALLNKYRKDQLHYILARPADRPGAAGVSGDLSGDLVGMRDLLGSYETRGLVAGSADRAVFERFATGFSQYVSVTAAFRGLADRGRPEQAAAVIGDGPGDNEYNILKSLITSWLDEKDLGAQAVASAGQASYHSSVALIIGLLTVAVVLALGVAVAFSHRVTVAVRTIGHAARAIANGEIVPPAEVSSRDELGDLAQNFDRLVSYLKRTIRVAEAIAAGDLDVEVRPVGDHDALGHALVAMTTSLRQAHHDLSASEHNLRAVARLAHGLPNHDNPRQAVCEAASEIAHAEIVQLWEPAEDGRSLLVTAAVGFPTIPELRVEIDGATSGTVTAYRSRQRHIVLDVHSTGAPVSVRMRELLGAGSALYEPVLGPDGPLGVLVVIWRTPITQARDSDVEAVGLLATEAAVAITRAEMTARLRCLARKDALTGLDNRRVWDEEFPRLIRNARRTGEPVCIAIADLDHFKRFNDTYGHQAGDRVLRTAAAAWSASLRETDLIARYGGEEFAVVLPNTTLQTAQCVLDRLRSQTPEGQTCSIGLAEWNGTETAEALLARADALVYHAKAAGRDQLAISTSSAATGSSR